MEFEALISDKTEPGLPDEIVTIDIDELSPDDVPLTRPGSVFYYQIKPPPLAERPQKALPIRRDFFPQARNCLNSCPMSQSDFLPKERVYDQIFLEKKCRSYLSSIRA
ncbi:MAG: hypothetical protein GY757_17940 [bacterium]|nr:hypothetical protein [bacterium]